MLLHILQIVPKIVFPSNLRRCSEFPFNVAFFLDINVVSTLNYYAFSLNSVCFTCNIDGMFHSKFPAFDRTIRIILTMR